MPGPVSRHSPHNIEIKVQILSRDRISQQIASQVAKSLVSCYAHSLNSLRLTLEKVAQQLTQKAQ